MCIVKTRSQCDYSGSKSDEQKSPGEFWQMCLTSLRDKGEKL